MKIFARKKHKLRHLDLSVKNVINMLGLCFTRPVICTGNCRASIVIFALF